MAALKDKWKTIGAGEGDWRRNVATAENGMLLLWCIALPSQVVMTDCKKSEPAKLQLRMDEAIQRIEARDLVLFTDGSVDRRQRRGGAGVQGTQRRETLEKWVVPAGECAVRTTRRQ